MSNSTACTRSFKKLKLSDSSTMVASDDSEYLTATATGTVSPAIPSSSTFLSVCSEANGKCTSVEQRIEHSKSHWSQVVEYSDSDEGEVAEESNVQVFKTLQLHPTLGLFFRTFGYNLGIGRGSSGELVVGEKFAEGGQAELFHAHVTWWDPERNEDDRKHIGREWALKVFKKGTFLRQLQSQWPLGVLQDAADFIEHCETSTAPVLRFTSDIRNGVLLEDGKFAFLMKKEEEDLRGLIQRYMAMKIAQDCGPFSEDDAKFIMYNVAFGMDWLHSRNIVHRDLKASNVLVNNYGDESLYVFYVADCESSAGVIGTGFFRAPEILQACKDRNVRQRLEVFTKEADVYSFGMTCYEILTGKLPFEGHSLNDYDLVLNGQQPELPEYVDDWARGLLSRCWHPNPAARPSFGDILNLIASNSMATMIEFRKLYKLGLKQEKNFSLRGFIEETS